MKKDEKIKVGISIGDLNGIGGEIVLKTFQDKRMLEFCTPVIFASVKLVSFLKKQFKYDFKFHGVNSPKNILQGKINVVNVWKENIEINFGKECTIAGEYSIKSLKTATRSLKANEVDVLITAPINKQNIQSESFKFPGHTNYLAQELNGESLMLMITNNLRVGLLTDHVPINEITKHITKELVVSKFEIMQKTLVEDFGISKPKIAVLGINPHTGDSGVIGNEDDDILRPVIKEIKEKGNLIFGPYAADSFFGSGNYKNFDAILASYHDQGLIPFKTLSFGKGVNYTAGLNKIRTSPDHGTAYEIAGKGEADNGSFNEAVFLAIEIFKNRNEYHNLTQNSIDNIEEVKH